MRIISIDEHEGFLDCFAHVDGQSYREVYRLLATSRSELAEALRQFGEYVKNSAEMKDADVPDPQGIRKAYIHGRLRGSGL